MRSAELGSGDSCGDQGRGLTCCFTLWASVSSSAKWVDGDLLLGATGRLRTEGRRGGFCWGTL